MEPDQDAAIYREVEGGEALLRWFGRTPSFHDAEILDLHLRRKGTSSLRLHGWVNTGAVGRDDAFVRDRQAIVTFLLDEVMDLQLEGFSIQNVIGGLHLRRAPDRPDRRGYFDPRPGDVEIELESCYGVFGLLRARSVAIMVSPGPPDARDA